MKLQAIYPPGLQSSKVSAAAGGVTSKLMHEALGRGPLSSFLLVSWASPHDMEACFPQNK